MEELCLPVKCLNDHLTGCPDVTCLSFIHFIPPPRDLSLLRCMEGSAPAALTSDLLTQTENPTPPHIPYIKTGTNYQ